MEISWHIFSIPHNTNISKNVGQKEPLSHFLILTRIISMAFSTCKMNHINTFRDF